MVTKTEKVAVDSKPFHALITKVDGGIQYLKVWRTNEEDQSLVFIDGSAGDVRELELFFRQLSQELQ